MKAKQKNKATTKHCAALHPTATKKGWLAAFVFSETTDNDKRDSLSFLHLLGARCIFLSPLLEKKGGSSKRA